MRKIYILAMFLILTTGTVYAIESIDNITTKGKSTVPNFSLPTPFFSPKSAYNLNE